MFNLIELTGQEIVVDIFGISFTLKDIANKFNLRHDNIVKQFEKDLNALTDEEVSLLNFSSEKYEVITGKNTKQYYSTYRLGVRETVWVISRFKADLRLKIVNYAFDKLKEEHYEKVRLLETKLSVKPQLECTNTNRNSRKARHEELMELVEKGCLDHEVKVITKHIYEVAEYGKSLGFYKSNGIAMFSEEV